jgi:hypothetical protein
VKLKQFVCALAAAGFCLAAAVAQAQTTSQGKSSDSQKALRPCSETKDPDKCRAKRKVMREKMQSVENCKDKPDRRACMAERNCAKSTEPDKCRAEVKERHEAQNKRQDERQKLHEACIGKRGDELGRCLGEQRAKSGATRASPKG